MSEHAEVVVVGGGIMGVSVAHALTQLGVRDVVVLERRTLAAGASGKTGALLRQHYTNVPEATLARISLEIFQHWAEYIGGECGFQQTGMIVTVSTSGADAVNIEKMHRVAAMHQRVGIRTHIVSPEELRGLQPFVVTDDIAAAAWEPDSGVVDAVAATRSMAEAAARGGARIRDGVEATAIRVVGDRVIGVDTSDGPVDAPNVVVAAGSWSVPLLAAVGVGVPIETLRVQVAVLNRPFSMPATGTMSYVDTAAGFFCRNWGPNRTLAGVGGGEFHDVVEPDDYDERIDPAFGPAVKRAMSIRMPAMADATVLYGHAGIYDMTPDTHPVLGAAPGVAGLLLALGFSGAGFKKGPAIGRCLAEAIVHGRSQSVDLTPFRLERFEDDSWRRPWSEDEYSFSTDFGHRF